jgi:hypothetical protein
LDRRTSGVPDSGGGKVISDEELARFPDPLSPGDVIDNICRGMYLVRFINIWCLYTLEIMEENFTKLLIDMNSKQMCIRWKF